MNEAHVTGSHDRNWDSLAVWTDTTTFGTNSTNEEADFKSMAFSETTGDDVLFVTDEYSFAFYNVAGSADFADFITNEYDTTACNEDFLASGADWSSGLTASESSLLSLIVRPQDTNASCFPNGNENALLGVHLSSCCWAAGLGNTPSGYANWDIYDNSVLQLSSLAPTTCTAGDYPCNDAGAAGYTYTNKATYTQVYVR
ncbi:MAG: hypothetical protein GY884_08290 [Proteobacteria bacterium]|nr:hypothetical protein [Pseudomonadota bacterium]